MKYYIIYKNKHFIGYTQNKNLLDRFLKSRKGKYTVKEMDESEISEEVKNSFNFSNCELTEYTDYYTDNDTVLFNYESLNMEDCIIKDCLFLHHLLEGLLNDIKYFKLSDEESKIIRYSLYKLIDDIKCITESNEIIFDEIINIHKYFYELYLPNVKNIKDIIENSFIQDY